jgi:hypothetical protein
VDALEVALGPRPERDDIAEKLVRALRTAGSDAEALSLHDQYGKDR